MKRGKVLEDFYLKHKHANLTDVYIDRKSIIDLSWETGQDGEKKYWQSREIWSNRNFEESWGRKTH